MAIVTAECRSTGDSERPRAALASAVAFREVRLSARSAASQRPPVRLAGAHRLRARGGRVPHGAGPRPGQHPSPGRAHVLAARSTRYPGGFVRSAGDHRVRVPHLACGEFVPAPDGVRHGWHQVEQPSCSSWIVAQALRALDRLAHVGDATVAAAARLVAEDAEAPAQRAPTVPSATTPRLRTVRIRDRRRLDREASLGGRAPRARSGRGRRRAAARGAPPPSRRRVRSAAPSGPPAPKGSQQRSTAGDRVGNAAAPCSRSN
jgi:hypothetical protein